MPQRFNVKASTSAKAKSDEPLFIGIDELCRVNPELRPPVIEGLLRQGETMNIIAPAKAGKSWFVIVLAIVVSLGLRWFGRFVTRPGRVLIVDNELHPSTIAHRIPMVAAALGVTVEDLQDRLCVKSLRGHLTDIFAMEKYFAEIGKGVFSVIILDAFYRFLPKGCDENSNADVAGIYNQIDKYAEMTGAAFVLIHHTSKGLQNGKSVTDVGAGAGSQSRATDSHLVIRAHKEENCAVLDAAVRSWKPVEPIGLRWTFPLWGIDDALDVAELQTEFGKRRKKNAPGDDLPPEWTPMKFALAFVTSIPTQKNLIMAKATAGGLTRRTAEAQFALALSEGLIIESIDPDDARKTLIALKPGTDGEKW